METREARSLEQEERKTGHADKGLGLASRSEAVKLNSSVRTQNTGGAAQGAVSLASALATC